jgi:hypothetical protein
MSKQLSPNTQEIFILIDERLMAAKNPKRSRHPRYFIVAAYSSKMKAEEAADGYLDALSFAPKGGSGQGWKQGKLTGEISKTTTSGKTNEKYGEVYATYRDDDAVLGHLRILKVNINRPPEDEIDYMTAEHFAGEMKSLVQTYVELRYPDDEEMQTALFENITSGKPSVSLEEIRDYVNARSAWYAESFNAPYAGAGALMDITKDTSLGNFTSKELTESSAIHGDFDHASLNYSGHQNLEARAESFSAETSQNALVLGTLEGEPAMLMFIQGKEDGDGFTTGRIIGCDSEEEVIEEAEKFRDAVGLDRLKKSQQSWKKNMSHAESFEAEDNKCCRTLKDLLEIIDPLHERGDALVDIHRDWRPEMQQWLVRLKEEYTDWECPDEFWDEYYGAESFSQWSQDEMNEPSHKGRKMEFDDWLDEEIESHGDIPLSEWGYEEEHDEPEHQHSESFNATRGIDTFAEPFEDLDDFYSGTKGAVKFVGLGVLVSVGIWMTKNKLLK